jgi:hypothetical protein
MKDLLLDLKRALALFEKRGKIEAPALTQTGPPRIDNGLLL